MSIFKNCKWLKTNVFTHIAAVFLVCVLFVLPFSDVVNAQDNQKATIRVGYFDYAGFIEKRGTRYEGYGVSYLDEISKYTDWQYEYVFDSWENLNRRLESGDIDLLCTMQYTPERMKMFDFCAVPSGLESGSLCVNQDSKVLFDDYDAFNGMDVGLLQNSYQNQKFDEYAKKYGFTYTPHYYQYMSDIEADLADGKLDALVEGGLRKNRKTRTVACFTVDPFYFVTTSGNNNVLQPLNAAMYKILTSDPDFGGRLYSKWYSDDANGEIVLTPSEKDFVNTHQSLRVALYNPTAKASANNSGVLYDTLQLISKISGIKFDYVNTNSYKESIDMVASGKVDIVSDIYSSKEFADEFDLNITKEYDEKPFVFIGKRGMRTPISGKFSVAVDEDFFASKIFFDENYPEYDIVSYKNNRECLKALLNKDVDMVAQKYDSALYTLQEMQASDLSIISTTRKPYMASLGVSKSLPLILVNILDKSISAIKPSDLDFISASNNAIQAKTSLVQYLRANLASVLAVLILALGVFFIISTCIKRKHTQALMHIAYTDILTGGSNLAGFSRDAEKLLHIGQSKYAILTVDINKFKAINNMYGYEIGDRILISIYNILKSQLITGELLCRDVADRFVLLVHDNDPIVLSERIEKIMELVANYSSSKENNFVFKLILSCGVCHVNNFTPPLTSYIDHSYMATNSIKNVHSSTFAVYDSAMLETLNREKELENMMDDAIRNNEFLVYLQPKIHLGSYTVAGSEALVRWQLQDKTIIQPDNFIPLFEKNGFIESVDFYMLTHVCEVLRKKLDMKIPCLPISINQSRFLFYKKDYLKNVLKIID
ncbi:MAG: transporter substrate-binding domain-containing protein, partial [Oscillospiraceae bacterium]